MSDKPNPYILHPYAWHVVVGDTLRDGRPIPQNGVELIHKGEIRWCESGLYASRDLRTAISYAAGRGPKKEYQICRVEVRDIERETHDKLVCRSRTILWRRDIRHLINIIPLMTKHFGTQNHMFYKDSYVANGITELSAFGVAMSFLDATHAVYLKHPHSHRIFREVEDFVLEKLQECSD